MKILLPENSEIWANFSNKLSKGCWSVMKKQRKVSFCNTSLLHVSIYFRKLKQYSTKMIYSMPWIILGEFFELNAGSDSNSGDNFDN